MENAQGGAESPRSPCFLRRFFWLPVLKRQAPAASLVLAAGAGALYLAQSSYWSVTADIAGARAGSTSGFMNMGAQFGGGVTAVLTPVIAAHAGWRYPFFFAAALSALGALAWLAVDPAKNLECAGTQ